MIADRIKELRRVRAGDILANPSNYRTHPDEQKNILQAVLERIGFAGALLARELDDGTLVLIDGHLRRDMDHEQIVPVLVTDLTEQEARELLAVYDPISAMAGQDDDILRDLLAKIEIEDGPLAEMLAAMDDELPDLQIECENDADDIPETPADPITKPGDLWILGDHRLLCGDSTKAEDVERLMGGEKAELIHADPPYGMGKEKDGVQNDNLYRDKLDAFQMDWWRAIRPHTEDNSSAYIWGIAEDLWRLWYVGGLKDSERLTLRNEVVWAKGDAGAGGISHQGAEGLRLYPQETERCLFFMLGEQGFNNNADNYWDGWEPIREKLAADCESMAWGAEDIKRITGVGMYCHWFTKSQWVFIPEEHYRKLQEASREHDAFQREHDELKREHDELKREFYATRAYFDNTHDNMTDVWSYPRVKGEDRHGHPTPKPVAMICRAIKSSTQAAALVYDPFLGSGTTMIAAQQLGRKCVGIEISPQYCDVIVNRWEQYTGETATIEASK